VPITTSSAGRLLLEDTSGMIVAPPATTGGPTGSPAAPRRSRRRGDEEQPAGHSNGAVALEANQTTRLTAVAATTRKANQASDPGVGGEQAMPPRDAGG